MGAGLVPKVLDLDIIDEVVPIHSDEASTMASELWMAGLPGKSALVSLYHMISCVRYEDSAFWMLHFNFVCLYLIDFANSMY